MSTLRGTLEQWTGRRRLLAAWAGLALAILIAHGRALDNGLFMDDHAHIRQLQECGWSLGELVSACRLELVGGIIDYWWMPECTLRFFRPLSFGVMKLTYTLSGWSPFVMHVASSLWHLAACVLLLQLLLRLGIRMGWAWVVTVLFAIHPSHVPTVQWIAAQTELMVTTLLLGATLCYAQFRGWSAGEVGASPPAAPHRWTWAAASAGLFVLSLGCRENAIMFPFVLASAEMVMWRRLRREVFAYFGLLGVIVVGYLLLRSHYLHGFALPPRPYVYPPTDPGFVRFVFDKACYYILGEFLFVPCVPIGGLPFLRELPLIFYGATAATAVVIAAALWSARRTIAAWLGPAWLLLFMAPVLPAFESPHHLYLPGVGWAIAAAVMFQQMAGAAGAAGRVARLRRGLSGMFYALWLTVAGGLTYVAGMSMDAGQAVEDSVVSEVAQADPPLKDGDTLYVANLPMLAHYVRLGVEARTGLRDLHVVALTWAPRLLGMASPSELRKIDEHTYEIRIAGDTYFSGPFGLLTQAASGKQMPVTADRPVEARGLRVELIEGDPSGIAALRFRFASPPGTPGVHLFWGSRTRWAYSVPDRPAAGDPGAAAAHADETGKRP